jgi:iron complex outermembrane recepter protein
MRNPRLPFVLTLSTGALVITAPPLVHADPQLVLQEVVVTAEKRSQSIQDVPISESALTGADLAKQNVQDIGDLSREVPTLDVQGSNGSATMDFRLRRMGAIGNIPDFEPDVGLFVDGAFRARSFFGAGEMVDLERVEVLNGPQSTLYGKNATAGVVALYTQPPSSTLAVDTEVSAGEMDGADHAPLERVKGDISGPLSDRWSASLAGAYSGHGYLFHGAYANAPGEDSESRYVGRGQLMYDGDRSRVRLIVEQIGSNSRDASPDATTFVPGAPVAQLEKLLTSLKLAPACAGAEPRGWGNCLWAPSSSNLSASDATALWTYHLQGGVTFNSVTSGDTYRYIGSLPDAVQLGAPLIGFDDQQRGHSVQQELRLTSPSHQKLEWLTGVFYYHSDQSRGSPDQPTLYAEQDAAAPFWPAIVKSLIGAPLPMATPGQESFVDSHSGTDYKAVFGQTTWNATRDFHLDTGIRWQHESKSADLYQFQSNAVPTLLTAINTPLAPTALSKGSSAVTWSVSPRLDLSRNVMAYATASRGFKAGGYNTGFSNLPASGRPFGDERVTDYELGVKSTLLHDRLRLNADVYDAVYHQYQVAAFVGTEFQVTNAEQATNRGAELNATALLSDSLTSTLNVSYAHLRYDSFTNAPCYPGRVPDGSLPGTCNLSGTEPEDAPPLKVSLGFAYHHATQFGTHAGNWFAGVDADWVDSYATSFNDDPRLTQDAYTWLRANLGANVGSWRFTLWGDNLLNKQVAYYDALLNLFAHDPSTQSFFAPSRSMGVTVAWSY